MRTAAIPSALLLLCAVALLVAARTAGAASLPADWYRGANLTSWWNNEWENPSTDTAIAALRATGSTDALFVTTWYMSSPSSSTVAPDPLKTPSDAGLLRAMAYAKSLGMRVELKLHVDVVDGTFRATIGPASAAAWFQSYQTMVAHYARLAQQAGADLVVLGTELTSMSVYTSEWRSIIATARSLYSGKLTFAANLIAGAAAVKFWDALDFIGVDAYEPLSGASNPDPSVAQLANDWSRYVSQLADIVGTYRRPVIFTEIGYQSQVGTAVTPWGTYTGQISQGAQQRAYEATYQVWSQVPWFKGIFWWDWRPSSFSTTDGDFNPRGKLAELTMTGWNLSPSSASPAVSWPSGPGTTGTTSNVSLAVSARPGRSHSRWRSFTGRTRRGTLDCTARVRLTIERRARGGRRLSGITRFVSTDHWGRFRLSRKLAAGSYRASDRIVGGACGPARGSSVRFTVS